MRLNNQNQMKIGALISYSLIIGNALFGVFVTPLILKYLGASAYGVYKTIGSLSASLLILDLGIGSTLLRYIAKYRAHSENHKIGSFVSMMICECSMIIPVIIVIEIVLYNQLDGIYSVSFSAPELYLAKQIFIILAINILLNIVENFLHGIISGHNDFVFGNGIKLLKLLLRIFFILTVLPIIKSAIFLVILNLILSVTAVIIELAYIIIRYHIKLNFRIGTWEQGIFKESFHYTALIFLTTIAAQVNNNLDNVIVGAFCGAEAVAVYSFGLVIFGMFEQLSTAISGVALPTVSRILAQNNWKDSIEAFIVKWGRIQFMLLGSAATGFVVIGKNFLNLWLGAGYDDVYWIVLILILPALFELCVNVCLAVLRAKNILGFRTGILFASTVLNFVVSVAGIKYLGYFSAAIGTAASFIIGSLVVMNIYYYKILNFNMLKIYGGILKGTVPALFIAGGALKLSSIFLNKSWFSFAANVMIFIITFASMMYIFGGTDDEKIMVKKVIKKLLIKVKK